MYQYLSSIRLFFTKFSIVIVAIITVMHWNWLHKTKCFSNFMNISGCNALKWPYGHYYTFTKNGANLTSRDRYVLSFHVKHFCKLLYVQQIQNYKSYIEFTEPQYFYLTGIQISFQINVPSKTPLWNNIIFQQLSPAAISVWPLVIQDGLRWAFYIHYRSTYSLVKIVHIHKNIIYLIHYLQILLHYDSC